MYEGTPVLSYESILSSKVLSYVVHVLYSNLQYLSSKVFYRSSKVQRTFVLSKVQLVKLVRTRTLSCTRTVTRCTKVSGNRVHCTAQSF